MSAGSAKTGKRLREKGRAARMVGVPVALAVAKAETTMGDMLPTFELPVLGTTKLSTVVGLGGSFVYMFSKNPGTGMTTIGLTSLVLAGRGL